MAINTALNNTPPASNTFGAATIKAAYDQYFELALRQRPLWRKVVDKRPVQVTNPGQTVTLFIHGDLEANTATLTDGVDVTGVTLPTPETVDITVNEKGAAVDVTILLKEFDLTDVDAFKAEQVAWNMEDSVDILVRDAILLGTNVSYGDNAGALAGSRTDVTDDHILSADLVRDTVTDLRVRAVMPKRGDYYAAYVHPHVSSDLRRNVGDADWRKPHEYTSPDLIWKGEVGAFEGAFFVETPRVYAAQDGNATGGAGGGVAWVYRNIFCGKQAIAEATAIEPHMVVNGSVGADRLRRLYTLGWYAVLGHSVFRQEALQRIETGSRRDGAGLS